MRIAIIDTLGLTYDGSTLNKRGLGGSESAVILMSRELAKIGFEVYVFNSCKDSQATPGVYDGVTYVDHSDVEPFRNQHFDIAISSRSVFPFWSHTKHRFALTATKRVLWMHDTFCEGDEHIEAMLVGNFIHEIFTLSDFHTNYVLNATHGPRRNFEVMKHKVFQTRNGAVRYDDVDSSRNIHHFVYNASVTKGLKPLLERIWPEVKKRIPLAKLTVVGGFYRFRDGAEPDAQEQTLWAYANDEKYKALSVHFTGVIPQREIAELLNEVGFMIYPTAFPETFGISTLEALVNNTPVITCRFGALEETALTQACYIQDYSATPNVLFPQINEEDQCRKFVDMVVAAHSNSYLYIQKQEYCNVLRDIHGWDTIALQWKQHFYTLFDRYLPVDEYRKVSRINDKVARVFGRRFQNVETRREYRDFCGYEQAIRVVSPFYNAEAYIKDCILSVACQDYGAYRHILIDDCSTDNSYRVAQETIASLPEKIRWKFDLRRNTENRGAVYNQMSAIRDLCEDNIVMLLDGDDALVPNNTIFKFYNDLFSRGIQFAYGSCWSLADNIPLVAQDYSEATKAAKSYRNERFPWNFPYPHLRAFSAHLLMNVADETFMRDGEWMRAGADVAVFYSIIENADPKKVTAVKEIMYRYNDSSSLNDYKINGTEQTSNANWILSRENNPDSNPD